jgi:hypothetical protein
LCGAPDCARFIGFYYRGVVDEKGRYYKDFPVPRFLCHRKGGIPVVGHRTFSLLHYQLIPYHKYSIPFVIKVLKSRHIERMTLEVLQKYISDFTATGPPGTDYDYIELTFSRIFVFQSLIKGAINKILVNQYYKKVTGHWQTQEVVDNDNQLIKAFLQFCLEFECHKTNPPIRGPCALSYDFYLKGGAHVRNSHFLFGTPSQFRF